jgi:hypothetical protein
VSDVTEVVRTCELIVPHSVAPINITVTPLAAAELVHLEFTMTPSTPSPC